MFLWMFVSFLILECLMQCLLTMQGKKGSNKGRCTPIKEEEGDCVGVCEREGVHVCERFR